MVGYLFAPAAFLIFGYAAFQLYRRRGEVPRRVWIMVIYLFLPVVLLAILTLPMLLRMLSR